MSSDGDHQIKMRHDDFETHAERFFEPYSLIGEIPTKSDVIVGIIYLYFSLQFIEILQWIPHLKCSFAITHQHISRKGPRLHVFINPCFIFSPISIITKQKDEFSLCERCDVHRTRFSCPSFNIEDSRRQLLLNQSVFNLECPCGIRSTSELHIQVAIHLTVWVK